jgi:hypothetical protein
VLAVGCQLMGFLSLWCHTVAEAIGRFGGGGCGSYRIHIHDGGVGGCGWGLGWCYGCSNGGS